jgi:beta-galactoside alpha-2,3-sialyltransferase (sialyltransferase 4A)
LRPKDLCRHAIGLAAVFVFIFLVPQKAASQEGTSPDLDAEQELETTARRPLPRRLEAAFPGSFTRGVDILWEPRDGWVSQEVHEWWVSRLEENDVSGVNREAAEQMLWRISGQSPIFSTSRTKQICAVVGASRNLLESRYGSLIDAHDVVFRVNRAPTDGFASDVGKKTTYHVMWPRELGEWEFNREAYLLMTPISAGTTGVFDRILTLVEDDLRWDLERVRIIHPEFVKYLHEKWTGERKIYPSTGFIALMIAVHVCDEVNVFGFGADAQGRWDRYYEDVPEDVSGFHAPGFEAWLRREMEEKGILKVFRGSRRDPSSRTDASSQD